jgi:putative SOS response-associated peptidase YedK
MSGRYLRRSDKQRLAEVFQIQGDLSHLAVAPTDYNIAPTTFQPVLRHNRKTGEREMVLMRWGLVPQFAKSLSDFDGTTTINARAETLTGKAMWRIAFETRRCIVPADGFYEWRKLEAMTGTQSRRISKPYAFTMKDPETSPFAFAGIWSAWKDPQGSWLQSFAIVTTTANELMAPIHNRMPVILRPEDYDRWLIRSLQQPNEAPPSIKDLPLDLLQPYPADAMQAVPRNPLDSVPL